MLGVGEIGYVCKKTWPISKLIMFFQKNIFDVASGSQAQIFSICSAQGPGQNCHEVSEFTGINICLKFEVICTITFSVHRIAGLLSSCLIILPLISAIFSVNGELL